MSKFQHPAAAVAMYAKGYSLREVGERYGVSLGCSASGVGTQPRAYTGAVSWNEPKPRRTTGQSVTPIPADLLRQMESFAQNRHLPAPAEIIHHAEVEKAARKPKRPKCLYWLRDNKG